ncbi:MAG: hypothetical protein MK096_15745, partial [Oleiphilaceae bacterium]|nr:hypothetical protein [Oleiphilaceae bacterium]
MSAWEFLKKENNARALGILIPVIIAVIGAGWTLFVYLINNDLSEAQYTLYLEHEITPFEDGYIENTQPPYEVKLKPDSTNTIWYLRRNIDFQPHALTPYFAEISSLTNDEIVTELNGIADNSLLHETLLPNAFYQVMLDLGGLLNTSVKPYVSQRGDAYPALTEFFSLPLNSPEAMAALYLYNLGGESWQPLT